MEEKDGLILGIDLQETVSQVSFYNEKLNIPQAVAGENGAFIIPNSIKLSDALMNDVQTDDAMEELISMLAMLIEYGKRAAGRVKVAQICITLEHFLIEYLDGITMAMNRLQYEKDSYEIISRAEAFAYYAYSQKKELYAAGTVLLDFNERGLQTYRMSSFRKNGVDYIREEKRDFTETSFQRAGKQEIPIEKVCEGLCGCIEELMAKKTAASIYLTGKGFDCEKLPEQLTKIICNRRKAFAGQNLYVKGACYAAKERLHPVVFDNLIMECTERISYKIETDISERGQRKRFRIIRSGTNWYAAERDMDFILEGETEITLILTNQEGVSRLEKIDISEIPFREGKTTRIEMNVRFMAADRCLITVKDKGFGQFIKPSGKVFYLELNLQRE